MIPVFMIIMTIMFGISAALAVVRNLDDAGFLLALTPKAGSHPNPSHVQTSRRSKVKHGFKLE